jgi:hypothetical protein
MCGVEPSVGKDLSACTEATGILQVTEGAGARVASGTYTHSTLWPRDVYVSAWGDARTKLRLAWPAASSVTAVRACAERAGSGKRTYGSPPPSPLAFSARCNLQSLSRSTASISSK